LPEAFSLFLRLLFNGRSGLSPSEMFFSKLRHPTPSFYLFGIRLHIGLASFYSLSTRIYHIALVYLFSLAHSPPPPSSFWTFLPARRHGWPFFFTTFRPVSAMPISYFLTFTTPAGLYPTPCLVSPSSSFTPPDLDQQIPFPHFSLLFFVSLPAHSISHPDFPKEILYFSSFFFPSCMEAVPVAD